MADIRWTTKERKKLHGRRAPHRADPPGLVPDRASGWCYLRERHQAMTLVRTGLTAESPFAAPLAAVLRSYEDEAPPTVLDPELERYRLGLTVHDHHALGEDLAPRIHALVGLWLDSAGATFTLDQIFEPTPFAVEGRYVDNGVVGTHALTFVPANPNPGMGGPTRIYGSGHAETALTALRAWLMAQPSEAFAAARADALPWWERAMASSRLQHRDLPMGQLGQDAELANWLSFAFSRDPSWAVDDAKEAIERNEGRGGRELGHYTARLVLASLTDPSLAAEFASRCGRRIGHQIGDYAYDVVDSLSAAAAPVLERLLVEGVGKRERKPIEAAIRLASTGLA